MIVNSLQMFVLINKRKNKKMSNLTPQEYEKAYHNLVDNILPDKDEQLSVKDKEISKLKDKIKDMSDGYTVKIKELRSTIQKLVLKPNPKNLTNIRTNDLSRGKESAEYFILTKVMIGQLNDKSNSYWVKLVKDLHHYAKQSVIPNSSICLTEKQKKVIDDWVDREKIKLK